VSTDSATLLNHKSRIQARRGGELLGVGDLHHSARSHQARSIGRPAGLERVVRDDTDGDAAHSRAAGHLPPSTGSPSKAEVTQIEAGSMRPPWSADEGWSR
jgi:hypothetical protein